MDCTLGVDDHVEGEVCYLAGRYFDFGCSKMMMSGSIGIASVISRRICLLHMGFSL